MHSDYTRLQENFISLEKDIILYETSLALSGKQLLWRPEYAPRRGYSFPSASHGLPGRPFGKVLQSRPPIAIGSGNHVPWYLHKGTEVYPPKHLHRGSDSSFIQHCQKLEAIKCPSGEWMNKLLHIQMMGCCLVLRRNELSRHGQRNPLVVQHLGLCPGFNPWLRN